MLKKISLLIALCLSVFSSCAQQESYFEDSGTVFNTLYQIKYKAPRILTDKIDAELQAYNLSLNPFNPNSIIAKVNRNEEVEVDDLFITVFNKSMEVSANSNGIFDITCAPIINLWGFGFSKMGEATPERIDSILQFVGYQKIRLEGRKVVKDDARITLNCSAIAKGYACDVLAALFEREGVHNYMIEIGGEVIMKGVNAKGNCWRIGIRKPEFSGEGKTVTIEEVVQPCEKKGIATSGDYQNFYEKEGKKFAHTINPKTGYPAEQDILSTTVIANDCMTADAYATAFNAMGLKEAVRVADSLPGVDYFFIYSDDKGHLRFKYSEGILKYLPNRQKLSQLENP